MTFWTSHETFKYLKVSSLPAVVTQRGFHTTNTWDPHVPCYPLSYLGCNIANTSTFLVSSPTHPSGLVASSHGFPNGDADTAGKEPNPSFYVLFGSVWGYCSFDVHLSPGIQLFSCFSTKTQGSFWDPQVHGFPRTISCHAVRVGCVLQQLMDGTVYHAAIPLGFRRFVLQQTQSWPHLHSCDATDTDSGGDVCRVCYFVGKLPFFNAFQTSVWTPHLKLLNI